MAPAPRAPRRLPRSRASWLRSIAGMALATTLLTGGLATLQAQYAPSARAAVAEGSDAPLPGSVDLTRWTVPAGDQGQVDACVPWAIAHSIMGWYANKMGAPTTFAPMYLYSQIHLSDAIAGGGGSLVRDAVNVATTQGVATINSYQPQGDYNFKDRPTGVQSTNAATYKLQAPVSLFGANATTEQSAGQAIKGALAAGTPVGLMIPLYDSFSRLDKAHAVYSNADATGPRNGYHYLAAFGYDATGVWVENSWSKSWGNNGFARLTWDFVATNVIEAEAYPGFVATSLPSVPSFTSPTTTPPIVNPPSTSVHVGLPSVVRKLHTVKRAKTSVRISWQAPANTKRPYGYWLVLSKKGYGTISSVNLAGNRTSITLSKLTRGSMYKVRLVAVNAQGIGKHAALLNVKTLGSR